MRCANSRTSGRRGDKRPGAVRFPPVQLLVLTTIGMMAFMVGIALDLGGAVSVLIFLLIVFVAGTLRAWAPLVEWIRGPASGQ